MRIAHFVSGFPVLSETFVLDEIAAFAEEGFENLVVALRPPHSAGLNGDLLTREDVERLRLLATLHPGAFPWGKALIETTKLISSLTTLVSTGAFHIREIPRLVYTAKRVAETVSFLKDYGVVHCHAHFAHYPSALAWGCARLLDTTYTWNAHSYDLFLYRAHLSRRIYDADLIFPVSEVNQRHIQSFFRIAKTIVCRCGIDPDEYPFFPPNARRLSPRGSVESSPVLLGVGRLVDTKGFADLIQALGTLRSKGVDAKVRIIGEGPERNRLLSLARRLGVVDRVDLLGALDRSLVREEQKQATIAVQPCCPGRNGLDGIPVVLMEAMALGLPVVSTRFAAIPELLEDGFSGRLVPPNRPDELAGAIQDLLERPQFAASLATQARAKVEADYHGPRNYREKARLVRRMVESRHS